MVASLFYTAAKNEVSEILRLAVQIKAVQPLQVQSKAVVLLIRAHFSSPASFLIPSCDTPEHLPAL